MNVHLQNELESYPGNPLAILDFRVLSWKIYNAMQSHWGKTIVDQNEGADEKLLTTWVRASWATLINRGPAMLPRQGYTLVIADDNGAMIPYWRKTELAKANYPEYKGQRPQKTDRFLSVAQLGLEYIEKHGYHYISVPAYEADDIAGAAVHCKRLAQATVQCQDCKIPAEIEKLAERPMLLYTVDTDWLQLVGNGVWWCNTGPWEPRVRGNKEAIEYTKKRLKATIGCAQEIVDVKMRQGDKSDNLPPGSPRWAIDLMNPLPKHHLIRQPAYNKLVAALLDERASTKPENFDKALKWLANMSLPTVF
jgi:hypothetical protein